jgi:hypothetical protein
MEEKTGHFVHDFLESYGKKDSNKSLIGKFIGKMKKRDVKASDKARAVLRSLEEQNSDFDY